MKIPAIIHLTAKSKNELSDGFRKNLRIMREFYNSHEFRIYDDADIDQFVSSYDPRYYDETFCKLPRQIMRVDAVRYLWMEAFGGIYFDFDIRLRRAWMPESGAVLVKREWTWPHANDITTSVHNCLFASEAGHPLWRHLLNGIAKHVNDHQDNITEWPSVFDVTGPNAISRTITREKLDITLKDVHILEPSFLFQDGLSTGLEKNAVAIHQTAGSWNESKPRAGLVKKMLKKLKVRLIG